jgi:hypothetical protein
MNFISLIAVILGIISVVITLKYVKFYSQLRRNLNKLTSTCADKNYPNVIFEIQNSLNLKDKEFRNFLIKNKEKIILIGKKKTKEQESESNKQSEESGDQPDESGDQPDESGDQSEESGDQSGDESFYTEDNTNDELFTENKESFTNYLSVSQRGLSGTMGQFVNDFKKQKLSKVAKNIKFNELSKLSNQNNTSMYQNAKFIDAHEDNFAKRNWCVVNHDDKNYCFEVSNKNLCKTKTVNNKKKCDF